MEPGRNRRRTADRERHEDQDRETPNEQGVSVGQGSGALLEPVVGPLRLLPCISVHACGCGGHSLNQGLGDLSEPSTPLCMTGGIISDTSLS